MYLILFILLFTTSTVFAARPLVTDDSSVMGNTGKCQVEGWSQKNKHSAQLWALPTCAVSDSLDLTIGAGYLTTGKTDYLFQIKGSLKSLSTNDMGIGLVIGAVAHPEITRDANQVASYYSYLPVSFSLLDDQLFIHTNLGWHYDKDVKEHNKTWGLAFEIPLNSKWSSVGELYGDYRKETYWQLGLRYAVIPEVFQLDTAIGSLSSDVKKAPWISLGFRWIFDKLF